MAAPTTFSTANTGGTTGPETSRSPSMGPGNGSTAIGDVAGGQATGGNAGGKPAPTGGDGTPPK